MTREDSEYSQEGPESGRRSRIFIHLYRFIVTAVLLALAGRLFYVQVLKHDHYQAIRKDQSRTTKSYQAARGSIRDSQGRILACSRVDLSVYADPGLIEDPTAVSRTLAEYFNLSRSELEKKLSREKDRFVWIRRLVKPEKAKLLKSLQIPGIGFRPEFHRVYPHGNVAPHVLGFVGEDRKGLAGVEFMFDDRLAGQPGKFVYLRDGRGDRLFYGPGFVQMPEAGKDVELTLDMLVQKQVRKELKKTIDKYKPNWASIVVMNPQTGGVLALQNYPSFSLKSFQSANKGELRNRAITDPVEPGSGFKPIVMAAAMEEGLVRPDTTIYCEHGQFQYRGRLLHDYASFGKLTATQILARSSNIGMAKIGLKMGEKLPQWVHKLGFGKKTGIQLPGEDPGFVQPEEKWNPIYTQTSVPMGHEILITPLQMVRGISILANGGRDVSPVILKQRQNENPGPRLLSERTTRKVNRMMREVVLSGTGRRAQSEIVPIAGKTGTSKKYSEEAKYLSVFLGMAPYPNPKLVIGAFVDEPNGAHGGGKVAAPVVRRIFEKIAPYMNLKRTREMTQKPK